MLRFSWAMLTAGVVSFSIIAAWMRWWIGELPPAANVAVLTFFAASYIVREVSDAWKAR